MQHTLRIWSHWFWITILVTTAAAVSPEDGLVVEVEAPRHPSLQGGEPSAGEPGAMSVTKSVSVSKVSVKMGDVREEGRDLGLGLGPELDPSLYLPIVNPRVTQQPPATFLRYLLDQLQQVAAVNTDLNMNHVANDVHYQLVYKDDTDYYSDYDLDHLSDEYLDYLYQIYDDLDNDLTYYDDDASYVDNDSQVVVALQEEYNDVDTAVHRSEQAQGRALDTEEGVAEQLFENVVAPASNEVTDVAVNKLEYVDKFLNISKQEVKDEATETTIEDFVVELKSTNNSDVYIKIGIFITVSLAVLVMTAGLIFVMMRRHKIKTVAEASLVTNEDEARAVNNQVVFQKGLKTSTTSSLQEHFNNHFGKSAAYLYDDLHSLDNDSFLTSLETISEKDKFNWE